MDLIWILIVVCFVLAAGIDGRLGWVGLALWVLLEKLLGR